MRISNLVVWQWKEGINNLLALYQMGFLKRMWLRISLFFGRAVYIGEGKRKGWKGYLPVYLIYCFRHGLVLTYPQGFDGSLNCLLCLQKTEKY